MTPIKRRVAMISAPVLLAFSLTACGGGAPADASEADFCEVIDSQANVLDDVDLDASEDERNEALLDAFKAYGEDLEEVGTPEDISDEAREGFEVQVQAFSDLSADDLDNDMENFEDNFSDEENDAAEAFESYASDTCGEATPDEPVE